VAGNKKTNREKKLIIPFKGITKDNSPVNKKSLWALYVQWPLQNGTIDSVLSIVTPKHAKEPTFNTTAKFAVKHEKRTIFTYLPRPDVVIMERNL
jgi:hypothetical protein